jgi:hypothetical protein
MREFYGTAKTRLAFAGQPGDYILEGERVRVSKAFNQAKGGWFLEPWTRASGPGMLIGLDELDAYVEREPLGFGDFLNAYIECALWSSTDNSDDQGGEPLDANYSPDDIAPETLERMRADCAKFYAANRDDIGGEDARAGHDFWLTRNGHGAGFWDGDWPEEIGERLTAASKAFPEVDLYVGDDGLIYS